LAADDAIVDDAFKQAGILRVNNVDEMFDLAECFLDAPVPRGNRVCILSEGGGDNSVAADNAERWGLEVPVLDDERQEQIRPFLLAGMPAHNPIDYGGTAEENPDMITKCVDQVMQDDSVDSVYITGFFGGFKDIIAEHVGELETRASEDMAAMVKKYQKPLLVHTSFAKQDYEAINALRKGGVPVLESSDRTAQCLAALAHQAVNQAKPEEELKYASDPQAREKSQELFNRVWAEGRNNLLEPEAHELLKAYGFKMPPFALAKSKIEAASLANKMGGYPLAAKIVSPAIIHKSDSGGVILNLPDAEEAAMAFEAIYQAALKVADQNQIKGVMLSPMAKPGQECIFGMIRDANFGPVLMFGLGGVYVEVLKDVSFGVAPVYGDDVSRMVRSIKGYPLLKGVRGQTPKDVAAVEDLLHRLSALVLDNPEIKEIDLNPVLVHESGVSIVDARIILDEAKES
jgi:acetyltransferase